MEEGLLKRFRDLEVSQEKLREQLGLVLREGSVELGSIGRDEGERGENFTESNNNNNNNNNNSCNRRRKRDHHHHREYGVVIIPGCFSQNPYQSVLQHIGHAVHVCRPVTGEIIYWNQSAEILYGWRDYEALGQNIANLLVDDESHSFHEKIMERLDSGQKWSGQLPFRKRSGEMFMAIVTMSPLYENNELIGVITVSSDSAILDDMNKEKSNAYWNEAHARQRESRLNFGRLRPQPNIASSVSNLASKLLPRIHAYSNDEGENSQERCGCILETENILSQRPGPSASKTIFRFHSGLKAIEEKVHKYEETIAKFNQQSKIAAKVFSKLNIRATSPNFQESDKRIRTNSAEISVTRNVEENLSLSMRTEECCASDLPNVSKHTVDDEFKKTSIKCTHSESSSSSEQIQIGLSNLTQNRSISLEQNGKDYAQNGSGNLVERLSAEAILQKEQILHKRVEGCQSVSGNSPETDGRNQTSSSHVEKKDMNLLSECDIRWEDLRFGEEVGQGSYAVVYRGVWNGSDVAIKVYLGKDYQEGLILDYKTEIAIMKRLRHPNVLLFMGAVYSPDRLAIVTEFLPRGSLFRTLHRNNQKLDLKRRLRMALDVVRGMNYLHRRNPPIIHRDLKSSNLLVDKNWTVKVGDFGLSCFKISTALTASSGRGTPQWMAPEVLRGECSNEKSDVFSFGVILWELMTESVPWNQLNPLQVVGVVGFMDRRLDLPVNIDPRVSAIICDCWHSDPERRPSFQQLLERMGELLGSVTLPTARRRFDHRMRSPPENS